MLEWSVTGSKIFLVGSIRERLGTLYCGTDLVPTQIGVECFHSVVVFVEKYSVSALDKFP